MVSKPVVRTLLCTPATPTSTPKVPPGLAREQRARDRPSYPHCVLSRSLQRVSKRCPRLSRTDARCACPPCRRRRLPACEPPRSCARSSCVKSSVGNRSRSTSRLVFCASVRPVEATATGAPLSSILVKLVPRPRIAMFRPSPEISRADRDAGHAIEGLGDVGIGKLADVFGEDRIGEVRWTPASLRSSSARLARKPVTDHFLQRLADLPAVSAACCALGSAGESGEQDTPRPSNDGPGPFDMNARLPIVPPNEAAPLLLARMSAPSSSAWFVQIMVALTFQICKPRTTGCAWGRSSPKTRWLWV